MKNIKLIIFDVDGVLIDSKKNMQLSWEKLCKKNNIDVKFERYFENIGISFDKILNRLKIFHKQKYLEKNYFLNSKKFASKIKPYNRTNSVLNYLQNKYILSIITSKNKKNTKIFLKKFFPKIQFSLICTPSNKLRSKPHPDLFNYTFKKLKISRKNSIFIGDTFHDLKASKNARTNFILAKYGYNNNKINFKKSINNISELRKYL